MRDIRFRAKRIPDGVWVQGQVYEHCPPRRDLIELGNNEYIDLDCVRTVY